jgi:hypothetical protein
VCGLRNRVAGFQTVVCGPWPGGTRDVLVGGLRTTVPGNSNRFHLTSGPHASRRDTPHELFCLAFGRQRQDTCTCTAQHWRTIATLPAAGWIDRRCSRRSAVSDMLRSLVARSLTPCRWTPFRCKESVYAPVLLRWTHPADLHPRVHARSVLARGAMDITYLCANILPHDAAPVYLGEHSLLAGISRTRRSWTSS